MLLYLLIVACSPDAFRTKGRDNHSYGQAITPARYGEGTFTTNHYGRSRGEGIDTITVGISMQALFCHL